MTIAGPHQTDRTLIELYADKMTNDPKAVAELFTEGADLHPGGLGATAVQGRAAIHAHATGGPKLTYKVTNHLPRQGEDNFAEVLASNGGDSVLHTVRFRTDGHKLTKLELVGTRKA